MRQCGKHSFVVGNGRIGRLLLLLFRQRCIGQFLYIDEKGRNEYYKIFDDNLNIRPYKDENGKYTRDINMDLFLKIYTEKILTI